MINKQILKVSFLHSAAVVLYVALVAAVMMNGEKIFGGEDNFSIPLALLLLFVTSASVTGGLVLGRPILWYLDNRKKEAVELFTATVGWLFMFVVIILVINIVV